MMLKFCTAEPAAPFTRLSITDTTNARPVGLVDLPADVAEVRPRDVLDLGQIGPRDADKGRAPVGRREGGRRPAPPSCPAPGAHRWTTECRDPAGPGAGRTSPRRPSVCSISGVCRWPNGAVGGDAAVILGEMRPVRSALCPRRDARLCVDDDIARRRDAVRPRASGTSASKRGRRIATRVRHEPCAGDRVALELGQAVRDAVRHGRGRGIPASARARHRECETHPTDRRRASPASSSGRRDVRGGRLGQREKRDVRRCGARLSRSSGRTSPSQIRASAGSRRGVLVACEAVATVSCDARMARQQLHQLLAGKAGRSDGPATLCIRKNTIHVYHCARRSMRFR